MRRVLSLLISLTACNAGPLGNERWELEDGTVVELDLGEDSEREERHGNIRFRLASGVTVALQEIGRDDPLPEGTRTPRTVAMALARRVELGEREGNLSTYGCRAGQLRAECLVGWTSRDEERFARQGAVLEAGTRIVWIDVTGPVERAEAVRRRSNAILETIRVESVTEATEPSNATRGAPS